VDSTREPYAGAFGRSLGTASTGRPVEQNGADLRPYSALGDKKITYFDHSGRTQYYSLQTQFISRFGCGSQVQASYTLARTRANLSMTNSDGLSVADAPRDLTKPDLDWGRPDIGRTHIFNASLVWLLPAREYTSGVQRALFGNWEIAAIVGAASGR
jgi:hypothetical protein